MTRYNTLHQRGFLTTYESLILEKTEPNGKKNLISGY